MLNSFRRLSNSKIGLVVLALIGGLIGLGFVTADMQNLGIGAAGSGSGDTVAKVGRHKIGYLELQDRAQRAFDAARQERPELTIQQFVREGGVDQLLGQVADSLALEQFAKQQGFGVSRKMEDAQIASAAAFRGLNGQFDQSAFEAFLGRQRISEKQLRADLARDLYITQLLVPATGATLSPSSLVLPYASMLLEQREGKVQLIPAAAMKGAAPTDAELNAYYRKNVSRYTVPERRTIRYALVNRSAFEAAAQPTEADITAAYNANKGEYAPKETRTISQVILPSEDAARELAANVAKGTPIADAARAAGLESVTLNDQTRETYTGASSAAVANAVFSAAQGAILPPARSGLGWHVARVDKITAVAGKTLDQMRSEITEKLKKDNVDRAMSEGVAKIEDAIADGATFDEVVAANKLQAATTPALLADGRNPDGTAPPASPEMAGILKAGFTADPNDDPTVEQVVPNQIFAVVKVDRVIAPEAKPLAQIREQVASDFVAERSLAASRTAADAIAAKINAGTPVAQALAGSGVALPAATTLTGRRGELLRQAQDQNRPELEALFTLGRGKARVVPAPGKNGWYVVSLGNVVPGDARGQPQLIEATRSQFAPVLGQEYGQELAAAARKAIGVTINPAAVARLKSELIGGGAQAQ